MTEEKCHKIVDFLIFVKVILCVSSIVALAVLITYMLKG